MCISVYVYQIFHTSFSHLEPLPLAFPINASNAKKYILHALISTQHGTINENLFS